MYVNVSSDIKDPLLKELRQLRLRSAIKYFPALVLIFSAVVALVVVVKGHPIISLFRDIIPSTISDTQLIVIALVAIVVITTGAMIYFLRQEYRDCDFQECLYCPNCNAVDKYDAGTCPICEVNLKEKALFYYTTYKDEKKVLERWGLQPCKERRKLAESTPHVSPD
jgi:hypothetical protein